MGVEPDATIEAPDAMVEALDMMVMAPAPDARSRDDLDFGIPPTQTDQSTDDDDDDLVLGSNQPAAVRAQGSSGCSTAGFSSHVLWCTALLLCLVCIRKRRV